MISGGMIHEVQRLHESRWGPIDAPLRIEIGRKMLEEAGELAMAIASPGRPPLLSWNDIDHEIGDVLFVALAACRINGTNPERALADAIKRNQMRWEPVNAK